MAFAAAIIGGTGIGEKLAALGGESLEHETRFGRFVGTAVEFGGRSVLAVARHGGGHHVPPHKVAYRAIAVGLAELSVPVCFSTAAVGSLHPEWKPGTFAACTDTIDVSARRLTLYDDEVRHTDFTHPFPASARLVDAAAEIGVHIQTEAVYINVDGPRYESPAEIRAFRNMGGDVVGMTAGTEAVVLAEAGVAYACLAIVTNLAAGLADANLAHGDVSLAMQASGDQALRLLEAAVSKL